MVILLKDGSQCGYLIEAIPIIDSTNDSLNELNEAVKRAGMYLNVNNQKGWTILRAKASSHEKLIFKNLSYWNTLDASREVRDFHGCYYNKLQEQARYARMIVRAAQTHNLTILNRIREIAEDNTPHFDSCYDLLPGQ